MVEVERISGARGEMGENAAVRGEGRGEEDEEGRTITATSRTLAPQGKSLRHAVTT